MYYVHDPHADLALWQTWSIICLMIILFLIKVIPIIHHQRCLQGKSLRDRWGRSEVGPGISSKSIYAVRAKSGSQICYQPRRPGTKKRCKFGKWEFFSMLFHFLKKVQWHWWLSYRITTSIWLWLSYVPWCPSQTSRSISNQILDDSIHLCRECFGFNSWRGEYSSIADADEEEQQSLLEVGGRSGGRGTSLLDGTEGEGL